MVRGIPVLGGVDDLDQRGRSARERGKPVERIVMMPSGFGAGERARADHPRGARPGLDRQSPAVA